MTQTIDTQALVEAGKTSVASLFGSASQALQGLEQLAALNVQAVKTTLAEAQETSQAAFAAKTPQELFELQSATLQAAPKKAAAYARQVRQIVDAATAQQRAAAQTQLAETQAKFLAALTAMLKNAPGSENTLSLVKTAVATASNALESVQKATRQVTEAVDANVIKFTETATSSVAKD